MTTKHKSEDYINISDFMEKLFIEYNNVNNNNLELTNNNFRNYLITNNKNAPVSHYNKNYIFYTLISNYIYINSFNIIIKNLRETNNDDVNIITDILIDYIIQNKSIFDVNDKSKELKEWLLRSFIHGFIVNYNDDWYTIFKNIMIHKISDLSFIKTINLKVF